MSAYEFIYTQYMWGGVEQPDASVQFSCCIGNSYHEWHSWPTFKLFIVTCIVDLDKVHHCYSMTCLRRHNFFGSSLSVKLIDWNLFIFCSSYVNVEVSSVWGVYMEHETWADFVPNWRVINWTEFGWLVRVVFLMPKYLHNLIKFLVSPFDGICIFSNGSANKL